KNPSIRLLLIMISPIAVLALTRRTQFSMYVLCTSQSRPRAVGMPDNCRTHSPSRDDELGRRGNKCECAPRQDRPTEFHRGRLQASRSVPCRSTLVACGEQIALP